MTACSLPLNYHKSRAVYSSHLDTIQLKGSNKPEPHFSNFQEKAS